MANKSRAELRVAFTKGRRPKQQDFWDWLDAYYHKDEDPIKLGGWQSRSLFKDLRGEGAAITTGGSTVVEIPAGAKRLKKIKVTGRGTATTAGTAFTITTTLVYYADKNVPGLNGVASIGNPFPTSFFQHALLGPGSVPLTAFTITSIPQEFNGVFDFDSIPKNVVLDFNQSRFLLLSIRITNGSFPNAGIDPSYVYYGLEFE